MSNLPFISKINVKAVLTQLQEHLTGNGLLETYQSAHGKEHSTERALLSVTDNLPSNTDNRLASIVVFPDLSAAFDTLDHQIMLKRLSITYGIHAKALQWFSSYLSDRRQSVNIGSIFSKPVPLQSGVHQGSVPGPIPFTLYTQPLSNTIQKINLTTTNMQMTPSSRKPPSPPISARFLEKLKSVLRT